VNKPSHEIAAEKPAPRRGPLLLYLLLTAASVVMLSLSLPGYEQWYLSFFSLVPILFVLQRATPRAGALVFWLAGFLFFLLAVSWISHLSIIGWVMLAFFLSLPFPLAALLIRLLTTGRPRLPFVLGAPLVWVTMEFLRGLPIGEFCWQYMGHALYRQTTLIQLADFSGVCGVSFVLVTVNALLARVVYLGWSGERRRGLRAGLNCLYVGLLLLGTVGYGRHRIDETRPIPGPSISVVQGNIPQELKEYAQSYTWEEVLEKRRTIVTKYETLTARLFGVKDDMVVWPETIVPYLEGERYGSEDYSAAAEKRVREMRRKLGRPFLTGSVKLVHDSAGERSYNAAYYFPTTDGPFQVYLKIHLVPFGEYMPLGSVGWIRNVLQRFMPPGYEATLSAGTARVLFRLDDVPFATPICYEDTTPSLIWTFTRMGARFIVNLTNDGWFRDTPELDQHLANSVFRTVENRIGLVRAANTGISGFVTPTGVITSFIADERTGRCREVEGVLTDRVWLDDRRTFYTAHGDLFARTALGFVTLLGLVRSGLSLRKRSRPKALDVKDL